MTTLSRFREPEIMDSPDLDARRHRRALDALTRINWISRSASHLWADIRPLAAGNSDRPLRLLDLACGGGDVAVALERLARRDGIALSVAGCDASGLAVQRARELASTKGSTARFFRLDVLRGPLPEDVDVVSCSLFLHHLDEPDAVDLLRRMAAASQRMVVVQDLERDRFGYLLAYFGVRVLTRSRVARFDGPLSVRAAYTPDEALRLARDAGFEARVRRFWPRRYNLIWERM